jgi:hypothetical protein
MSDVKKAIPGVEITLGGEKYKLIFTMRSFMLVEKETGLNALDGNMFSPPSATNLITLLWAGLQHKQAGGAPDLTIDEVGEMLSLSEMGEVAESIQKAFEEATATPSKKRKALS